MMVVTLCLGVTTSFVYAEKRQTAVIDTDSVVVSKEWSFRPITMQNPDIGTTRDIFAYNFYFNIQDGQALVHLPVEWISMSVFMEEFSSIITNYSATFVDDSYWRILFTIEHQPDAWAVEVAVEPATGRTQMAIVAREGVMRYIGALYPLKREVK